MISSVELISKPVIATATPVKELSSEMTRHIGAADRQGEEHAERQGREQKYRIGPIGQRSERRHEPDSQAEDCDQDDAVDDLLSWIRDGTARHDSCS